MSSGPVGVSCSQAAREQVCFANVEADWCYIVVGGFVLGFFDRELDGDVERPRCTVLLQSELSRRSVPVYEIVPQTFLSRIDTKRYPEIRPTTGLGCPPCKFVVTRRRVVELGGLIGEPNRVVVVHWLHSSCHTRRRTPRVAPHGRFRAGHTVCALCGLSVGRVWLPAFSWLSRSFYWSST